MTVSDIRVYFDVSIGDIPAGRMVFELFNKSVPKTCENFRVLCTQEWTHSYLNSTFHRVIKDFMIQGGDFTNHDGTGGHSIYPDGLPDEDLTRKHDQSCMLSMANCGPDTNGSQFFITSQPCPHLDGKHVVFGRLIYGEEVFRAIENIPTDDNDAPLQKISITKCGELIKVKKQKENDELNKVEDENDSEVDQDEPKDKKRNKKNSDKILDEDINPYIIGVAPPPDCEASHSNWLDRGGAKDSRSYVKSRKSDTTDHQGRKVKGRGSIVS
ncbi:cyclophilin-like domain-containing protein [Globomyces pollinis-pini]|nr:cyclophilin-like domain-containing protein [Globomyces pollinis-pini]